MDVPSREEFEALKQELATVKSLLNQILAARVTVEWVGIEVAEIILDCSGRTIYRLIKKNELAILKTGKKVRIGLSSIRAYLLKNKYQSAVVEARINSLLSA